MWLEERLVLDVESLSLVTQRTPSLLGLNMENNLKPTIKLYEDSIGSEATINLIDTSASLLTHSIVKELKPRLATYQEAGVPIHSGTVQCNE